MTIYIHISISALKKENTIIAYIAKVYWFYTGYTYTATIK